MSMLQVRKPSPSAVYRCYICVILTISNSLIATYAFVPSSFGAKLTSSSAARIESKTENDKAISQERILQNSYCRLKSQRPLIVLSQSSSLAQIDNATEFVVTPTSLDEEEYPYDNFEEEDNGLERTNANLFSVLPSSSCSSFTSSTLEHESSASSNTQLPNQQNIQKQRQELEKDWKIPSIPKKRPKLSDLMKDNDTTKLFYKQKEEKEEKTIPKKIKSKSTKSSSSSTATTNGSTTLPWEAGYQSSIKVQNQLKLASQQTNNNKHHNRYNSLDRAIHVMETLHNTPPSQCNEANIVYSLTLTANILKTSKLSSSSTKTTTIAKTKQFHDLLHQTLDILHTLVVQNKLNTRQLANASWAIAKHYSYDALILPPSFVQSQRPTIYSSEEAAYLISETWDLNEIDNNDIDNVSGNGSSKYESEERVLETFDEIATRLITAMTTSSSDHKLTMPKTSELSMISWAYAILKPRLCPPGWDLPPRSSGSITTQTTPNKSSELFHGDGSTMNGEGGDSTEGGESSSVIFQNLDAYSFGTSQEEKLVNRYKPSSLSLSRSKTDELFDTIASTLLLPQKLQQDEIDDNDESEEDGAADTMLQSCMWRELSNIAWAFAHHGQYGTDVSVQMMHSLVHEVIERLNQSKNDKGTQRSNNDFLTRDITEIVWALGSMQSDNHLLSDALIELVDTISSSLIEPYKHQRPLQSWKSADLIQLAVALAHGRIDDINLMNQIYGEALQSLKSELGEQSFAPGHTHSVRNHANMERFKSWELAVLLWVQARLHLTEENGKVFQDFAGTLPRVLLARFEKATASNDECKLDCISLGPQEKANIVWSLTVLEQCNSPESIELLEKIFRESSTSFLRGEPIGIEHAHQLWQSICILEVDCPEVLVNVDNEFYSFLEDSWIQEKARMKCSSARHKSLSQTLDLMGVAHFNEHEEDIDVALVLKSKSAWTHAARKDLSDEIHRKVAVEFDGPNHFTQMRPPIIAGQKPDPPRALGHTVLKYRLLKRKGWTVVRVPYYEYDKIPYFSSMERQRYLQRQLKTHANIRFSDTDVSEYKTPVVNRQSRFD